MSSGEREKLCRRSILHCSNSCQKLLGVYRQELSLADAKAFRFVLREGLLLLLQRKAGWVVCLLVEFLSFSVAIEFLTLVQG